MNHAHRGFSTADRVCLIVKNARVRWRTGSDSFASFCRRRPPSCCVFGDHIPSKKTSHGFRAFVNHAKQTRVTWPDYNVGLHRHSHVRTYVHVLYLLACLTEAGERHIMGSLHGAIRRDLGTRRLRLRCVGNSMLPCWAAQNMFGRGPKGSRRGCNGDGGALA